VRISPFLWIFSKKSQQNLKIFEKSLLWQAFFELLSYKNGVFYAIYIKNNGKVAKSSTNITIEKEKKMWYNYKA